MSISDEMTQNVLELYAANNSITSIQKMVGISQPTISKILKNAGVEIRKTNYQTINLDKALINQMYQSGLSTYAIAKELKVSDETIRKLIDEIRTESERNRHSEETKEKIRVSSTQLWQDDEYIKKVKSGTQTEEYKHKLSEAGKRNYHLSLGKWIQTTEAKLIISKKATALWASEVYRAKQEVWYAERGQRLAEAFKLSIQDPIKRQQWIDKLRRAHADRRTDGWISSPQKQLYYILSTSGINFHEEGQDTKIGPFYTVDCVVPIQQKMRRPLIIEVQGEYWHSLPHVLLKDRQKATYIRKHTDYDLLALDELRLQSFSDLSERLSSYGLQLIGSSCRISDLEIRKINETEAKLFYSVFHYSGTIRKGAIVFGAFLQDVLVAAISYCYPLRRETSMRLELEMREIVEISRLARRTTLTCTNLASFLISKSIKLLPTPVKCIISFSDSTYGHTGGVYKASGFVLDGTIDADYSYISLYGRYHKKTIWDRAKKMKMTEQDYAQKHGLVRVMGLPKTRWVRWL